jgi:hypothetical protein
VITALAAERASRLKGRRPSRLPAGEIEPEPVPITRATAIGVDPFPDDASAREWLDRCRGRGDHGAEEVAVALAHVNRAIAAYRVCAADPLAHRVSREQAVRVRLGYGTGPGLVDGAWKDAYVIPREHGGSRRARRRMLAPEEEMAGMLTGRRPPAWPSEELLLRARGDLDDDRPVEAALQARAAVEALAAEVAREGEGAAIGAHAETAATVARAALAGGLDDAQRTQLEELVVTLERAVRRRRYSEPG